MAFTSNLVPETKIEEAQDGMGFKIFDQSVYGTGDLAKITSSKISIKYIDGDNDETVYDYIDMGAYNSAHYLEFQSQAGHLIETSDLHIDGVAAPEVFIDGYYEITLKLNDGTYTPANAPYYLNSQAFLAKYRAMRRIMPADLLAWPITPEIREKNYDVYTLGLYLDNAEDAADLGKKTQFRTFIALMDEILDYYEVPIAFANKEVDRCMIVAALRRQGDPKAREMEEQQLMLGNVLYALRDYDITSDLLSTDDIEYLFELATIITQTKP
jgi:hypothetical protein